MRRRAERVIRPTRAKTRRLRVLVITVRSPRPIRAVQRARLCAITWTASQRGSDQRQHLVPSVRPSRRAAEVKVMVDEFSQAQVPGEGGRQEQAGSGHQAMVVKEDADTVENELARPHSPVPLNRMSLMSS